MSHYIQDTQAVVKLEDNVWLMFTKGGDNNVYSQNNNRCTSWWCNGSFDSKEDYDAYIDAIMLSDINGGSWQFKSLKNKSFDGFTKYESLIYGRFNTAFKKALPLAWKSTDITVETIVDFEEDLVNIFRENNISFKDEDGYNVALPYILSAAEKKDSTLKEITKISKHIKVSDKRAGYRDFCEAYKSIPKEECFSDENFCKKLMTYRDSWNGMDFLKMKGLAVTESSIKALIEGKESVLIEKLWDHDLNAMFESYPEQFYDFLSKSKTVSIMESFVETVDDENWRKETMIESLKTIKKFIKTDHITYAENNNNAENQIRENALDDFVAIWNELDDLIYFKTTNKILERSIKNMKKILSYNEFTKEQAKKVCSSTFSRFTEKYEAQMKKNQPAIKKLVMFMINEHAYLLREDFIDELCLYFKVNKPKKEIVEAAKEIVAPVVLNTQASFQTALF